MDVSVREATNDDVEALLPLWRRFAAHLAAFDGRYASGEGTEERWHSWFEARLLDSDDGVLLLAQATGGDGGGGENGDDGENDGGGENGGGGSAVGGEVVGLLAARVEGAHPVLPLDRHGRVDGLYVRENVRNRGVGRALLDAAEDWFRAEPRDLDFYRVEAVDGDGETAAALRGLDLDPVSHIYESDA